VWKCSTVLAVHFLSILDKERFFFFLHKFENILPGLKKAEKRKANDEPTDPETPRNKDLKYDREKRTRIFQNSWIDKFPWVVFDGSVICQGDQVP
jgi:hypothetical protein